MSLTVTDLFAGFGGASSGAVLVPGIEIRIAANHWQLAVDVHNDNHPDTDHACVDLHLEDPSYFPKTDILWASPECTKWSQAGGAHNKSLGRMLGQPDLFDTLLEDDLLDGPEDEATRSRLLMFDVLRFIERHRYAAVIVENVVDIATQAQYASAWRSWRAGLASLGYEFKIVSLNSMHAQALGMPAPQSRDRLYVVAWPKGNTAPDVERFMRPRAWCSRCERIVESRQAWKNGRTVGRYRAQYVYVCAAPGCGHLVEPGWLPAAAAIDWSLPGVRIGDRDKPLAAKTTARIKAGIARYWSPFHMEAGGNQYDAADPKHAQHGNPDAYFRVWPVEEYLRVLHTAETKALVVPVEGRDGKVPGVASNPLRTLTTRSETALAMMPFLAQLRRGNAPESLLAPYYGASDSAKPTDVPVGTLTTHDRYGLVMRNNTARGDEACMSTPTDEYLRTLTTSGHQSLITADDITDAQVEDCYFRMLEPREIGLGMAFSPDYLVRGSRRDQVKGYGNAVTPPAARDLVGAVAASLGAEVAA